MTGFHYSGVEKSMKFNPMEGKYFWANGYTYGTIALRSIDEKMDVKIEVLGNKPLEIREFELRSYGKYQLNEPKIIEDAIDFVVISR